MVSPLYYFAVSETFLRLAVGPYFQEVVYVLLTGPPFVQKCMNGWSLFKIQRKNGTEVIMKRLC